VEATKLLKPPVQRGALGDLASLQAVTRVNAVQASKKLMQELTRHNNGESGNPWESTSERVHGSCRGSGDGMQTQGTRRNTGNPSGDRRGDQPVTRESQAGPRGVAERPVVLKKPGNVGGGKGPQLKGDARRDKGRRDW
jgi:hypothetical protein